VCLSTTASTVPAGGKPSVTPLLQGFYHHGAQSGLDHRHPKKVRHTWDDAQDALQEADA
jgi:hypothetical protein